jgi:hypothetical protein
MVHLVGFYCEYISWRVVLWMSYLFRSCEGTRYLVGLLKTNSLPCLLTQHAFLLLCTQINDLALASQSRTSSPLWWPTGWCCMAKLLVSVVLTVRTTTVHSVHSLKLFTNAYFIARVLPSFVRAFLINFMDSWFQTFAVFSMLYVFFWVILDNYLTSCLWRWNRLFRNVGI